MRVNDLPTDGVFIGKLFQLIAEMNINLDTISQQLSEEGRVNFSFYCSEEQSDQILENTDRLGSEYPIHRMLGFIKLSVIGVGISTHSGIASKVLNTLNANGIRYYMITSARSPSR
ncbi:MAG: ACT domain-containing protein [Merdibacter sp.]